MKVLITGGSGFIGNRLINLLRDVNELNIVNYDKTQSQDYPEITVIGDVRNFEELNAACKDVDVIYNLAAEHADNVTPLSLYYDVNVGGAENVIKAAENNNIKKIIFTSSVAIYGLNRGTPNEYTDAQPFNEYGRTKLQAEKVFNHWLSKSDDRTLVTVRPAVVFGENNRGNVYNLITQIASGRFLMIGDGKNCKSMGYVGNVAEFLKVQLEKKPGYYVYNYADKDDLSSSEIVSIVRREMNLSSNNFKVPYFIGLMGGYTFDILSKITGRKFPISAVRIQKFCAETTIDSSAAMSSGFVPPYTLEEGLKRMIQHEFNSVQSR
ncbi:NAD-dependent epimerase/dehydratase family protein [Vibrio metschnikovii]|uniref:NAD-dependent epimerase/dehydratase family protein n=1 Tax=Vibrio metschnikovii TaxID=28172 RepID=UPI001C301F24|nr:NAD-dependent epimerase/dehydratase family protein [Vibrio metschnikovii]